ncbi:MAG TPA: hypothetical protein VN493_11310 [Thermoanaerobaculia bacterium]|nr:hypothetical protein [Thermoanaerobaculia bacterium]
MSDIRIHDHRLTFLWTETLPELLAEGGPPAGSSMPFLWSPEEYAARFAAIPQSGLDLLGLSAPWPKAAGDFFWTYYLEDRIPGSIQGELAWRYFVPFRGRVPATVKAPWFPGRLSLESFFFPHGLGLAFSARTEADLAPEEVMAKALELRRDGKLEVEWSGGKKESLNLDAFGIKALQALRTQVTGTETSGGTQSLPFSIATIVRAAGVDAAAPFSEGEMMHKVLQGLTTWSPTWKTDGLKPLAEAGLPTRYSPSSYALYAGTRGRAVWFPGHYVPEMAQRRSLSCYHRNFVFLSLQVESLAGLAAYTAKMLEQGEVPGSKHAGFAKRGAGILGRLYGGTKTYRSHSPKVQMDQNQCVKPINEVRDYFNMAPLA